MGVKMKQKTNDIVKNMYKNPWWKTFWGFIICFFIYIVRNNITISENTLTIINVGLMVFGLVALYQIVKEKVFPVVRVCFLLVIGFIMNQYYVPEIFMNQFHIELVECCMLVACGVIAIIVFPLLFKSCGKGIALLGDVVQQCVGVEKEKKEKKEKEKKDKREKREQKKIEQVEKLKIKEIEKKKQAEVQTNENRKQNNYDVAIDTLLSKNDNLIVQTVRDAEIEKTQKQREKIFSNRITHVVILLIIILFPIFFVGTALNEEWLSGIGNLDTAGAINIVISLMSLIIFGIFIGAVAIGIILKLVQTVFDIMMNKDKKSYYLIYVGVFVLISFYFCEKYNYTIDNVANAIVKGKIFSFPLILVILLPVFLTFLDNFCKYIEETPHVKEEIVSMIHRIASEIVISLLKYIKFITADFLSAIGEIVEGDLGDGRGEEQEEKKTGESLEMDCKAEEKEEAGDVQ